MRRLFELNAYPPTLIQSIPFFQILLPRCGYLPLAAAEAIDRFLRGFAADIQGPFTRRLWFETTEGGTPLQWCVVGWKRWAMLVNLC